jgi:hypothetical protein
MMTFLLYKEVTYTFSGVYSLQTINDYFIIAIFPEYTSEAQSSETLINQSQCSWNMDLESLDGSGSLFHEDGDPLAGLEMNLGSIGQTWLWGS